MRMIGIYLSSTSTISLALEVHTELEEKFWKDELHYTLDSILTCNQNLVNFLKTKNAKECYIVREMKKGF